MGKSKGKPAFPKELCERINFLYQACHVATISSSSANDGVAAVYGSLLTHVAERAVIKLDSSVKRSLCKVCKQLLLPGISATCRIRSGKTGKPQFTMRCLRCRNIKRYVCDPLHGTKREEKIVKSSEEDATQESNSPKNVL